jgi:hypothetical protein
MKDLYENAVLAEWRERHRKGDVTLEWIVDHVMPELIDLVTMGHATVENTAEGVFVRPVEGGRTYYPVPETMPDAEAMFTHFIGSGADQFEWWQDIEYRGLGEDGSIAPDWEMRVAFGADGDEEEGVINPASLAQAVMRVKSGVTSVRQYVVDQCVMFAAGNLDGVDFDACDADSVMQIAITGHDHIYG